MSARASRRCSRASVTRSSRAPSSAATRSGRPSRRTQLTRRRRVLMNNPRPPDRLGAHEVGSARSSREEDRMTSGSVTPRRRRCALDRIHGVIAHGVIVTAICLSWSTIAAAEYRYPYHDPYVATATSAIVNADRLLPRLPRQVVRVSGLLGRNNLPSLERRGQLSVVL